MANAKHNRGGWARPAVQANINNLKHAKKRTAEKPSYCAMKINTTEMLKDR